MSLPPQSHAVCCSTHPPIIQAKQQVPSVDELVAARNYVGAVTVLNFKRQGGNRGDVKLSEWLAYSHFHAGEHDKARLLLLLLCV